MKALVKLINKRRLASLFAAGAVVASSALALVWNALLGGIIDGVSAGVAPGGAEVARALALMATTGAAAYCSSMISGYACEGMAHDLRMGYARHIASLPVAEAERLNSGEQISRLQNELADVSAYLGNNLFQLFGDCIRFAVTFGWLLSINARLALSANLPVFAIMVYVYFSSKAIGIAVAQSQEAKERMNRHADAMLTLFPIIKLYDAARMTLKNYGDAVGSWEQRTVRAERVRARLMSLSGLLSNVPLMLLFLIGGGMVLDGALTVGALYVFLNLSGNVSGVMMNMPGFISAFRQFTANMGRLAPKLAD